MSELNTLQRTQGGNIAPDGVPLQFSDLTVEYDAALNRAVLMDRSHEGRLRLTGQDRLEIMHRISTNDLHTMAANEGRPTIFTNANARIIDRVVVYNRADDALVIAEPGRGDPLAAFLQRQIFFNDDAQLTNITAHTHQFVLHGPQADTLIAQFDVEPSAIPPMHGVQLSIADIPVFATRRKPLSGQHWSFIVERPHATAVWQTLSEIGESHGIRLAGAITYNMIRIRSGRPAGGRELSTDFIPLEVGLWDEVSFTKGCYTGQEIIARMESRGRLAKTSVRLQLNAEANAPQPLLLDGKSVGTLTSSFRMADGEVLAIGVVKTAAAVSDQMLHTQSGVQARVLALAAAPPPAAMLE